MKILVVDDSAVIRKQLIYLLGEAGYEVIEADNGSNALEIWQANYKSINLIITDFNMPGLDGISMMKSIRSHPHGGDVKAMMLTTESTPGMKALGKEVKLRAWVTKPYSAPQLLLAIQKLLA